MKVVTQDQRSPEQWRPVVGWEGVFEVSDAGRVRALDRVVRHSTPGVAKSWPGRILTPVPDRDGYLHVCLTHNGRQRTPTVHKIVLEAFVGPCPGGMEARHLDDDKSNNVLSNLCWGTPKENAEDKRRNGRMVNGERSNFAKITAADVMEIRQRCAAGEPQRSVARSKGIRQTNVSMIVRRQTWRHVP